MKKITALFVCSSLLMLSSCVIGDWDNGVSGEGDVISKKINIHGFTGVHTSSGIDVFISQGDFFVEVVADENLHQYITVEKEGDMLKVGSKKNIYRASSKRVNVTLPELTGVRISSAGDIRGLNTFDCDDVDVDISSAGNLDLDIHADEIRVSISSSGDCNLSGSAYSMKADLSSAGGLYAYDLIADYLTVKVSSAGNARVTANKEISMSATSAGNIYYKGDASVIRSNTSSAGNIVRR